MRFALFALALLVNASFAQTGPHFKDLAPPPGRKIQVAFLISDGTNVIDFAGPWEVFTDVMLHGRVAKHEQLHPFHLYTVSESPRAIRSSGGMRIVPDYTFADAPRADIVVVPAQNNDSPAAMAWIRKVTRQSDVVMSVCTGAFLLAKAGVLDGKSATTHHEAYATFAHSYPAVALSRKMRFVRSDDVIFTAGGLSSGIDLALHVVDLYYGRTIAEETARHLELEGRGWAGDGSAAVDFTAPPTAGLHATLDNLDNHTYENPSTAFVRNGNAIEFSFNNDPSYSGTLAADGNVIEGVLHMDDGSNAPLRWTRTAAAPTEAASVAGDWTATLERQGKSVRLVLHVKE